MSATGAWTLRRARLDDAPELLDMMAAFNRVERIPFRRARVAPGLRRLLRERRLGTVVVADGARGLGGYAVGTLGYDLEFAGPDGFVTDLFVRARHRRAGLGALLLEAAVSALHQAGARAAHLAVRPENRPARRLYARRGFTEVPRLLMSRVLD
jgi:[ribosomal protein S18]-alanine N-acetyltransferase